jgi:hypothetical protein
MSSKRGEKQMNMFENKKIRSCRDDTSKRRWFSVVDVCAVIRDCDYKTARNYWKWLKSKLGQQKNQAVSVTNQLKMEAADGKLRYTDVMDAEEVLQLIQDCPSPKAEAFRVWIAELAARGEDIIKHLTEAASKVKHRVGKFLLTIRRKEFNIFGAEGEAGIGAENKIKNETEGENTRCAAGSPDGPIKAKAA